MTMAKVLDTFLKRTIVCFDEDFVSASINFQLLGSVTRVNLCSSEMKATRVSTGAGSRTDVTMKIILK